jgi:putative membrane protein
VSAPQHGRRADRLSVLLFAIWLVVAVVAGVAPYSREDWLLENVLVPIVLMTFVTLRFGRPPVLLSKATCFCLFLFLVLHEVGAHYTYSLVPYRQWIEALGVSLPACGARNQYDRWVHLSYGLLVSQPVSEILAARGGLQGRALRATTVAWMAFGSMLYELIEWMAAVGFGGDLGIAYLGTQGDPWDAQKDMALALLGSLLWACVPKTRV